jgi:hypothetical protein
VVVGAPAVEDKAGGRGAAVLKRVVGAIAFLEMAGWNQAGSFVFSEF